MKHTKFFLLVAAISCFSFNVMAQNRGGGMAPQRVTDTIKKHVTGITADQETKILAIEQAFAKDAKDARANSDGDRDAMRTKMETLRKDRDEKIKGVLTADQYTQYTQMPKEHWGGKRGGGNKEE